MKKVLLCVLIASLILASVICAHAEVPSLSEKLFSYAKGALTNLASGDYDKVVTKLPFSDVSPSADEWRSFTEGSFSNLSGSSPQTKYAVAYWTGRMWEIAVPISEPSSDGVETLVLLSEDGSSFCGYSCSSWGSVCSEYESSSHVIWNEEYNASTSAIVENDQNS